MSRFERHMALLSPRNSSVMREGLLSGDADTELGALADHSAAAPAASSASRKQPMAYTRGQPQHKNNLGWMLGVVFPTILNVIGVSFYLQYPYIVGQYGVLTFVAIMIGCQLTVFFTILSLSAVVTNGRVGGGGCYFLISRAMGPELGGAIGLVFFCANVVGVAQAQFGVGAAIQPYLPLEYQNNFWVIYGINSACFLLIFILAVLGAEWFTKVSVALVILELGCCVVLVCGMLFAPAIEPYTDAGFLGPRTDTFVHSLLPSFDNSQVLPSTFGMVFAGVTGIMTGANMSGDLRDPAKAIPKGTLIASFMIFCMYMLFIPVVGASFERSVLKNVNNTNLMGQTWAYASIPFIGGLVIASLSNTLESVIGAARVLQAVARDGVLPLRWFAYGSPKGDEPRVALILVYVLAQLCMLIPTLALLATYSAIFLLMAYAFVNLTALLLSITGTHNWRPTWRAYSWPVGLLGTLLCFAAMFLTNVIAVFAAIGVILLVLLFIRFVTKPEVDWGDLPRALLFHQVRKFLLTLHTREVVDPSEHVKFWRPHVLCCAANPDKDMPLMFVAHALKKGGMFVIGSVDLSDGTDLDRNMALRRAWDRFIVSSKLKGLSAVVRGTDTRMAFQNLMVGSGMGSVSANTFVMGWPESLSDSSVVRQTRAERTPLSPGVSRAVEAFPSDITSAVQFTPELFMGVLEDASQLGLHILVGRHLRLSEKRVNASPAVIDVWALQQGDRDASLTTALLLADGIRRSSHFATRARVRLFDVAESREGAALLQAQYEAMVEQLRFSVEISVLVSSSSQYYEALERGSVRPESMHERPAIVEVPEALNEIVARESGGSDLLFVMMRLPSRGLAATAAEDVPVQFVRFFDALTRRLPPTLLIRASRSVVMEYQ